MDKLIGQTLGRYKLLNLLGKGGMGAVFKAHDMTLQRDVALKIMRPELADDATFRQRFVREAQAAARLDHPGITKIYDFGNAGDLFYIVMELILGPTLQDKLEELSRQHRGFTLPEALELIRQLAFALAYVHEHGVLHRDLKPANIMLKPMRQRTTYDVLPYQAVITDLGLAKLQDSGLTTQIGQPVGGTPAYMSPEQAKGEPLDARSDIYSLGVLLYELTVGQRPFPINSLTDAVHYHIFRAPPPPHSIRPDLPPALEVIILRTLDKEPANRFRSAEELAHALEQVTGQTATSSNAATTYPSTEPYNFVPPPQQSRTGVPKTAGPQTPGQSWNKTLRASYIGRHGWLPLILLLLFGLLIWGFIGLLPRLGQGSGNATPTAAAIAVAPSDTALPSLTNTSESVAANTEQNSSVDPPTATSTLLPATSVPTIAPTSTVIPTPLPPTDPPPTATLVPTPTPPPTPTPIVLKAPYARPTENGLLFAPNVQTASTTILIDGNPSDWDALQNERGIPPAQMVQVYSNPKRQGCAARYPGASGAVDLAGTVRFAYDDNYLYVGYQIEDDGFVPNPDPMYHWQGDATVLFLDVNMAQDFASTKHSNDDFQIDLLPGKTQIGSEPSATLWTLVKHDAHRVFSEAQIAASVTSTGYFLETALPWESFGKLQPQPGLTVGVAPGVNDNDTPGVPAEECMFSAAPNYIWANPGKWATLLLQ